MCTIICLSACSWTAGESVEENAYLVLRLLIRRPECFGPALRGDGGHGLLAAMKEAINISEDSSIDGPCNAYQSNATMLVSLFLYCLYSLGLWVEPTPAELGQCSFALLRLLKTNLFAVLVLRCHLVAPWCHHPSSNLDLLLARKLYPLKWLPPSCILKPYQKSAY